MCRNQLGRRNITDEQKTILIGEAYKAQKMTAGWDRRSNGFSSDQNDHLKKYNNTSQKIADDFGVGEATVRRAEQFVDSLNEAEKFSPGIKDAVLSGTLKAPKSVISEIRNAPEEKKREAVEAIKKGDTDTAKAILRPIPKVEPEEPPAPFTVSEFQELIHTAIKALDASLKQHMVLVHREMLDISAGRDAAMKELDRGIDVIEKYKNMIRMVSENGTEN